MGDVYLFKTCVLWLETVYFIPKYDYISKPNYKVECLNLTV